MTKDILMSKLKEISLLKKYKGINKIFDEELEDTLIDLKEDIEYISRQKTVEYCCKKIRERWDRDIYYDMICYIVKKELKRTVPFVKSQTGFEKIGMTVEDIDFAKGSYRAKVYNCYDNKKDVVVEFNIKNAIEYKEDRVICKREYDINGSNYMQVNGKPHTLFGNQCVWSNIKPFLKSINYKAKIFIYYQHREYHITIDEIWDKKLLKYYYGIKKIICDNEQDDFAKLLKILS